MHGRRIFITIITNISIISISIYETQLINTLTRQLTTYKQQQSAVDSGSISVHTCIAVTLRNHFQGGPLRHGRSTPGTQPCM